MYKTCKPFTVYICKRSVKAFSHLYTRRISKPPILEQVLVSVIQTKCRTVEVKQNFASHGQFFTIKIYKGLCRINPRLKTYEYRALTSIEHLTILPPSGSYVPPPLAGAFMYGLRKKKKESQST